MKNFLLVIFIVFIAFMFKDSIDYIQYNSAPIGSGQTAERAKILEVIPKDKGEALKIELLTGDLKGAAFIIDNSYYFSDYYVRPFKENNVLIVSLDRSQNGSEPVITLLNYARDSINFYLLFVFFALLVAVGKKQGAKSAVSLIITILIIIKVMLPLILQGYNPIICATLCCFAISVFNLLILTGVSRKTTATLAGTSFGVLVAGLLSYAVGILSHFSGLNDDDSLLLTTFQQGNMDLNGILFAGILIGTLGAVMDVSMSVSSAMYEITANNPRINKVKLIRSGLNVGRDVMGTMADTLILAYASTAIPLLLFSISRQTPLIILLNSESISTEILRALSGSIGIILSIPATSFAFAIFTYKRRKVNIS